MTKRSLWRLIFTTLICGACAYFFVPLSKVRLGLDLKGGVHFELEVQGQEALEADLRDTRDRLLDRLHEKGFPEAVARLEGLTLKASGVPAERQAEAQKVLGTFSGYDTVFSGDTLVMTQKSGYQKSLKDDANKRAQQIIENRINQFGVAEPEITPTGAEGNRIVVELPGVGDAERERIKGLLTTPGRLEQRLVAKQDTTNGIGWRTREEAMAHFAGQLPPGTELLPQPLSEREARREGKAFQTPAAGQSEPIRSWVLVEEKVYVDGADITKADPTVNPQTDQYEISYVLNKKGADDFYNLSGIASEENRRIAVVLDRKVVSVLWCKEKIPGGAVRITGQFSKEEADDFALKLKSGAMRASMKFLEERAMGPSLGADSIASGIRGALIGFLTVIGFMVFYYRWSGVNAVVALTVNIIVMLGLMGSFHAVITLPGIAGFALTVGMAVDANILIFERIREELANGKSVSGAIQTGFDRVFWTIVDSHVTQLVSAILLFIFGTGPVKGFAVTLTVGVTASLFTSIYISRFIYDWILERHPGAKSLSI
ncbi:protein translocase subunit SecD [Mesoterricola silvestris]|uniref:Protein translocase subunit SecD n=1 Tax=Mesoterricola silvestris TaxID=2927979 RepID=A0AA48GPK5_9BACT|nr:protein translocase subunit SecD [Mesoterricola silvestris]BDU73769.1 protein translocase subunit SecD [Mesoterricola silvestris]